MRRDIELDASDYYGLLEVDPSASVEVIKVAYETLKSKNDGLEEARTKALEVLTDQVRREEYDQQLIINFYGRNKIGNYQIIELISENNFSRTYRAMHLEAEKPVWITHAKKLSPRSARILKEEMTRAWDITYPTVSDVIDFFKLPDGQYVIVSKNVVGMTMDRYVKEVGVITPKHIAWIIDRLLNTLMYLWDCGRIHGNINPLNIILQSKHRTMLIGSNFAGILPDILNPNEAYEKIFMSPEQIAGEKFVTGTDFFSLSKSMVFGLTGDLEIVRSLKIPNSVPAPLREFLRVMAKKDMTYRPSWDDGNLLEEFRQVRKESFGSEHGDMEPLPGLPEEEN